MLKICLHAFSSAVAKIPDNWRKVQGRRLIFPIMLQELPFKVCAWKEIISIRKKKIQQSYEKGIFLMK